MAEAKMYNLDPKRAERAGAEFTPATEVDLHKASEHLLSPEAARALLLAHQAYEVKKAAAPTYEKPRAQVIAEYAIACGINLDKVRINQLSGQKDAA